jgi:hypothetical protein
MRPARCIATLFGYSKQIGESAGFLPLRDSLPNAFAFEFLQLTGHLLQVSR